MIANQIEVPPELIKYIASLPDDSLKLYIRNKTQLEVWKAMRRRNELLSESWNARHTGKDEPLRVYLNQGTIDKVCYEILIATLDYYDSLWVLCHKIFPEILEDFKFKNKECPFKNALSLFSKIVSDRQTATFDFYLAGYVEFSKRASSEALRLHAKKLNGEELSDKEEQLLKREIKKNRSSYNLVAEYELIRIAKKFANTNNPGIKRAYDSMMQNYADLNKLVAKSAAKIPSYIMEFGEITKVGQKGGCFVSLA